MKIKPIGNFVVAGVDVKDGDTITILDEGEYRKLPQDPKREVLTFKVEIPSGAEKSLSVNATSQKNLIEVWGDDSENWIDKQCRVEIVKQQVFEKRKDVIYLYPINATPIDISEEEIPVVEK